MRVCREFRIIDTDWIAKRKEYRTRKEEFDKQWQDLRENERQLRLSFLKFDDFIKDNHQKCERASRKIEDQKHLQQIRRAEIKEYEDTLMKLKNIREKMQKGVEKYQPFKKYLEVVLKSSEFTSIAAIFNRYETLIDARETLEKLQLDNLHLIEETSIQLKKMTEEKTQKLMDLNSWLANLQSRRKHARMETLHAEALVAAVKQLAGRTELEETQVRGCMWNLYRQICKRKDIPVDAKPEDLEQQMLIIKRTIVELGKIVDETKRKNAREKKFHEKELAANAANRVETKTSLKSTGAV